MEKLRRIRYTQDFKLQAVKMVDEDGLGVAEVGPENPANWMTI